MFIGSGVYDTVGSGAVHMVGGVAGLAGDSQTLKFRALQFTLHALLYAMRNMSRCQGTPDVTLLDPIWKLEDVVSVLDSKCCR